LELGVANLEDAMPENVAAVLLIVSLVAPVAALFAGLLLVAMGTKAGM
jgi:hypothetical protein